MFALLIAPIVAGIAVNIGSPVLQKMVEHPKAEEPTKPEVPVKAQEPAAVSNRKEKVAVVEKRADPKAPPAVGPAADSGFSRALARLHDLPINHLYNGRDLSGFYTYLGTDQPKGVPLGKDKDPDKVFSVKSGLLLISGREMGGLTTAKEYENYLLTVEYQWGRMAYRPRANLPKHGTISFHAFGPDGAKRGAWLTGYRTRLDEIGAGDLGSMIDPTGEPSLWAEVESHVISNAKGEEHTPYTYKPRGTGRQFRAGGLIFRLGTINHLARNHPGETAGPIWEKPSGDWNTLEILCVGDTVGIILNGTLVNAASKLSHTKGKIQLATDRADILFRTVDLRTISRNHETLPGMPRPTAHEATPKATEKKATKTLDKKKKG
jgi:Domain of Unknown Function (DUF1080)